MPYELRKQDGGYKVGKKDSSKTFSKKPMSKEKAKAQLAALHINAPKESTMKTKEQVLRELIRKEIKQALESDNASFTKKHDDNPALKGDQDKLPDELQKQIIAKKK